MRHQLTCDGLGVEFVPPKKIQLSVSAKPKTEDPESEHTERHTVTRVVVNARNEDILLERIEQLERELKEVKKKPPVHHHWNIVVGGDFFSELVDKMGRGRAVEYLSEIATEGKPLDVINKLYLEGTEPTSYPIACRDEDHFRYMDSAHRIVDDKGGHGISQIVSNGVHRALVTAANEAICDQVDIQNYVADMRNSLPPDRIVSQLAHMTSIPDHPFFRDEDEIEAETDSAGFSVGRNISPMRSVNRE